VIALDLRVAIARAAAAAGFGDADVDPKLRPGGRPGTYASSIAFGLATGAEDTAGHAADGTSPPSPPTPAAIAEAIVGHLATEDWVARAEVSGNGYIAVTVTTQALARVAARITAAGPRCAGSDVLRGVNVPQPPPADLDSAATWEEARAALAAELTARLAEAAGATALGGPVSGGTVSGGTVSGDADGAGSTADGQAAPASDAAGDLVRGGVGRSRFVKGNEGSLTGAIAFAGRDAVRFALARSIPGKPLAISADSISRNSLDNPAYAVRYAHARAASGVRWAAALDAATSAQGEAASLCLPADPADLALLDALSWLPERVAIAARRGRPDEFARYLEELSRATIAALRFIGPADDERLALARDLATAARTGLAAGLGLLGVTAPDRL
jgi:DALR anticodon binding domain/Arginyl tRNA synthetase N terminal domain